MSLRDDITFEYPLQDGPIWPFRSCGTGRVTLTTTQVLIHETPISIDGRLSTGVWNPEMTIERFVAIASCDHCGDPTSMAGETHTRPSPENNLGGSWTTYLAPRHVYPPPLLVHRPGGLPTSIEHGLTRAEGLFWSDYQAAGSVVCNLIEGLLAEGDIKEVRQFEVKRPIVSTVESNLTMGDLLKRFELLDELIERRGRSVRHNYNASL